LRSGLPIERHISALREGRLRLRELLDVTADSSCFAGAETRRRFDAQSWTVVHYRCSAGTRSGRAGSTSWSRCC
jgi:hypothetical protein